MPAPSWRMYPARIRNLWLATSASAGASRSVGINSCDQRCILGSVNKSQRIIHCNGRRQQNLLPQRTQRAQRRIGVKPLPVDGVATKSLSANAECLEDASSRDMPSRTEAPAKLRRTSRTDACAGEGSTPSISRSVFTACSKPLHRRYERHLKGCCNHESAPAPTRQRENPDGWVNFDWPHCFQFLSALRYRGCSILCGETGFWFFSFAAKGGRARAKSSFVGQLRTG